MRNRTRGIIGALAIATLALTACSAGTPRREPLETAVPEALLASDLGIVTAEAGTETSGFAVSVFAAARFESDAVTADDLRTMMELVVANTDRSGIDSLTIVGTVGPPESETFLELGSLGVEMGFPEEDELASFSADWDDVVAYLEE
jgi:hypothetical protein